jgi:hypothetical protein
MAIASEDSMYVVAAGTQVCDNPIESNNRRSAQHNVEITITLECA